jgi:hypothetical protein
MKQASIDVVLRNAAMELEVEQAQGTYSPCGEYDLVILRDELYRAEKGLYENTLMKAPLPSRFWGLPRLVKPYPSDAEPETSNEFMAVAADRVWVLKKQNAPHKSNGPGEPILYFSRNLHDLMSLGLASGYFDYSLSYVKAQPIHNHWFQLMTMLNELEPMQNWRAYPCAKSALHSIAENLREWHCLLLEAKLAPAVVERLAQAILLTKTIMEELK